ncbi:thioredoxin-like protein CXXS1 isoform X2 [Hibiscus syriacus]|uniref:thioredoxin-like protein CXXS1 isoform X2 n=1 Tax=Hibiscus syriacus TaxID=106335 RepID=UPI001923B29B|nr:thioredoxin-like protein CXXS1 isoform X2 [Hibiscus syriacus]
MERQEEQQNKSRVVKIDSVQSWDFYFNLATNQGCPIFVHFTAAWCIPSVAMNPFFEELALTFQDLLFLTVDVDDVKMRVDMSGLLGGGNEDGDQGNGNILIDEGRYCG